MEAEYRRLPSVDALAGHLLLHEARELLDHAQFTEVLREVLADARASIAAGQPAPDLDTLARQAAEYAATLAHSPLSTVINATGVVIHTNLGRAPISRAAAKAAAEAAQAYSNLEFDLDSGQRGSRDRHIEQVLCRVTGAEAALAVNNNASALVLTLSALASGKEGIISRGQAVEIGGGFRIPDVMRQSGVRLVEVGTTNRTYLADYQAAITGETAVLMRVHSSNFRVIGFTAEAALADMVRLADERGLALIDDVGSGCLIDTRRYGLAAEPLVQESIAAGAGIVCFSGDKLLGGPQAGLIAGKKCYIDRIRRHPLARAVRIDKMTLAALLATLLHYLRGTAEQDVPVWQMIAEPEDRLKARAEQLADAVGGEVLPGRSTIGGGSLPEETLPTHLVGLRSNIPADALARRLRLGSPAVVARIERDQVVLDPRTVLIADSGALISAVQAALAT